MGFYIPWLVDAARLAVAGTGKQVIAEPGWQNRGHGPMRVVEVVVGHHTGTPNTAAGDYPSLRIVRDGRADLAGPLAHYGLARSGNVSVIAAGLCYHAGASAYLGFTDLNDEAIGIEAESAGAGGWTGDQLLIYPRLVTACLQYMRRGVDRYASHRTIARPAGRKPDPTGIADDWMRQRAASPLQSLVEVDDVGWDDTFPGNNQVKAWEYLLGANRAAWDNNRLLGIALAKFDALSGALATHEASIIAATRQIVGDDPDTVATLTPEQAAQFADQILTSLPTQVREAVREAFARAGQETTT